MVRISETGASPRVCSALGTGGAHQNPEEKIMSPLRSFSTGMGARKRQSHVPPISGPKLQVQGARSTLPSYPFQNLPAPNGNPPYRFDLSQLLTSDDITAINNAGSMVFHSVGDTGDYRGTQQDFVAAMMAADAQSQPANLQPAFYYHLGDVVYFAGDIIKYPDNFYATYKDYPAFIVGISGNHDCQPDDPSDGPGDPNKTPFDGWVQNFMSSSPVQPGTNKILTGRTQMDLPNVYWTFTTPFATIIGLCSNVGEDEGEFHPDQITWFQGELTAAAPNLPLIIAVHHPAFSGDDEHTGSTVVDQTLTAAFQATGRYPDMVLSGHVHNYQRFTNEIQGPNGPLQIPYIVAGAGGYTKLGSLQQVNGQAPAQPLPLENGLTLECYDDQNFGFLRFAVSKTQIIGTYLSAPFSTANSPVGNVEDTFTIDLVNHTVTTNGSGGNSGGGSSGGSGSTASSPNPPTSGKKHKKKR
jgi:acid phosphatase type 7